MLADVEFGHLPTPVLGGGKLVGVIVSSCVNIPPWSRWELVWWFGTLVLMFPYIGNVGK